MKIVENRQWQNKGTNQILAWLQAHLMGDRTPGGAFSINSAVGQEPVRSVVHVGHVVVEKDGVAYSTPAGGLTRSDCIPTDAVSPNCTGSAWMPYYAMSLSHISGVSDVSSSAGMLLGLGVSQQVAGAIAY